MGRPELPKGEAKTFQIGVRFTEIEAKRIKAAIALAGVRAADWARNVLLSAADRL